MENNDYYVGWNLEKDLYNFLDLKNDNKTLDIFTLKKACIANYMKPIDSAQQQLNDIRRELVGLKAKKEQLENNNDADLNLELIELTKIINEKEKKDEYLDNFSKVYGKKIASTIKSIKEINNIDDALKSTLTSKFLILNNSHTLNVNCDEKNIKEFNRFYDFVINIPSITSFLKEKNKVLEKVDSYNRIVPYDKTIPSSNSESRDKHVISLKAEKKPNLFEKEYGEILKEAGIYAFNFGKVGYKSLEVNNGEYTQEFNEKIVVGVLKRNQFGELKHYVVLMNDIQRYINPEFYRDIMFSDLLLENSKNNLGFLGIAEMDNEAIKKGKNNSNNYKPAKVTFSDIGIDSLLSAIYLDDNKDLVKFESNWDGNSFKEYINMVEKKILSVKDKLFEIKDTKDVNNDNEQPSL